MDFSWASVVQLPSNAPQGGCCHASSSRPSVGPIYNQSIKYDTISARVVGATLIHAAMILLWIKASIRWRNEHLFMYFMKFVCVLYLIHTHKPTVEWYSSYLDEILAVSKSSLSHWICIPPPSSSSSTSTSFLPAVPLYRRSVILTDVSVTWD